MHVPEGWEQKKLQHITSLIGDGLHGTPKYSENGKYFFINGNNLSNGRIVLYENTKRVDENEYQKYKKNLNYKTLLLSINGTIGNLGYFRGENIVLGKSVAYLNLHDNVNQDYIFYMLDSVFIQNYFQVMVTGTTIKNLSLKTIRNTEILLPPLAEQEKIAEILSTWDDAIEQTERLKANAETHKKALMQQLLTGKKRFPEFRGEWEEYRLKDVAIINPRKAKKPNNHLVSFLGMADVSEDGKILTSEERQYDDVSKGFSSFKDNDVLIAKITPCFENGKGAIVSNLINGIGFGSTEFHVVRTKENKLFPLYLFYLTYLAEFRVRGERNMQGSAGQKRVPTDYLATYKIKLPSLEEQQKIASVLNTADREIELLTKKIEHLKSEKRALMQQLLTGKRRVKVDG